MEGLSHDGTPDYMFSSDLLANSLSNGSEVINIGLIEDSKDMIDIETMDEDHPEYLFSKNLSNIPNEVPHVLLESDVVCLEEFVDDSTVPAVEIIEEVTMMSSQSQEATDLQLIEEIVEQVPVVDVQNSGQQIDCEKMSSKLEADTITAALNLQDQADKLNLGEFSELLM